MKGRRSALVKLATSIQVSTILVPCLLLLSGCSGSKGDSSRCADRILGLMSGSMESESAVSAQCKHHFKSFATGESEDLRVATIMLCQVTEDPVLIPLESEIISAHGNRESGIGFVAYVAALPQKEGFESLLRISRGKLSLASSAALTYVRRRDEVLGRSLMRTALSRFVEDKRGHNPKAEAIVRKKEAMERDDFVRTYGL